MGEEAEDKYNDGGSGEEHGDDDLGFRFNFYIINKSFIPISLFLMFPLNSTIYFKEIKWAEQKPMISHPTSFGCIYFIASSGLLRSLFFYSRSSASPADEHR